jgi:Flp pilus assembly protein protease CpaA
MLATVVLLGLVLIATATDLRRHKIYNWTTYPGILFALGLSALGELLLRAGVSREWLQHWLGCIGFRQSIIGFLVCGGLMLVCLVLSKVGGGDVKLIAMLGAFLGWELGISAMLWTFVLGSAGALIVLVWRVGPWRLVAQLFRHLGWMLRLGKWVPLTAAERAQLQPPLCLAPSALAAVVIVRFFNSLLGPM